MIKNSLRAFVETIVENKRITKKDVRKLQRYLLEDGIASREEADTLIALERAVPADPDFAEYLVRAVVDFAVWGARPTGYVDQDTARWLVATLSCGEGPSAAASRIAFEIVKEAEQVDEALLASRCAARVIALAADGAWRPLRTPPRRSSRPARPPARARSRRRRAGR